MAAHKERNLSFSQQLKVIGGVARLSFKIAPGAVTFKLIGALINALLPIITTYFAARTTTALADAYAGNPGAQRQVVVFILLTASMGLFMTVWQSFDSYVQARMRYVIETRISNHMYEHFLSLDFWHYDDKRTVDLYDKARKFVSFYAWVFDRVASLISYLIAAALAIIALAYVNVWLTVVMLLAILPGVFVQFRVSRQQVRHWNENIDTRRALNLLEWNLLEPRFITELRLYGMTKYLLRLRTSLRDKDERKRIEIERRILPLKIASDVLRTGAEVGALLWIGFQIVAQKQPLGQFVFVQQMVARAITSASALVSELASVDEDIANLFDYKQFMELPASEPSGQVITKAPNVIKFDSVSFKYRNDTDYVLEDVSFEIKNGQHIAIVGENGAGKSTLVKLLAGLYQPSKGRVIVDDLDLKAINISSWHRLLSVLQQEFITYGFATARQNVEYGDVEAVKNDKRITKSLKDAEALDFVHELPKGLDNYVNNWMEDDEGNKGKDLSGGQWQRLALARDFYRNAPIVILDEPTSAIDALAEARIFERLFSNKQRTVIAVSHRLSTIKKADVIVMFKRGKIVESGSYKSLLAKRGDFYNLFEDQL